MKNIYLHTFYSLLSLSLLISCTKNDNTEINSITSLENAATAIYSVDTLNPSTGSFSPKVYDTLTSSSSNLVVTRSLATTVSSAGKVNDTLLLQLTDNKLPSKKLVIRLNYDIALSVRDTITVGTVGSTVYPGNNIGSTFTPTSSTRTAQFSLASIYGVFNSSTYGSTGLSAMLTSYTPKNRILTGYFLGTVLSSSSSIRITFLNPSYFKVYFP